MTTPAPSTPWVPVWPQQAKPAVPTPLVNGKWMTAAGGAMTWADLPDPGLVTPDTGWHIIGAAGEPQFGNAWNNYGGTYGPARFRKTADGMVLFDGLIYGGWPDVAIFWMNPGFLPPRAADGTDATHHFYVSSSLPGSWGTAYFITSGTAAAALCCPMDCRPDQWISLAGISYHAEG